MKVLIGLGNPEVKYKTTRHNTGFLIMDEIMKAKNVTLSEKFNSFFAKKDDIIYLLPKTYMNLSGKAVIECLNFYKLTNKDILVIYDDATLQFGTFRFRSSGSFGGHNGIKSIIQVLSSETFDRLKVGVGPVREKMDINSFVLGNFTNDELVNVKKMASVALDAVDLWLKEGILSAQSKYNGIVI